MAKAKPVEEPGLGHNVLKASELTSFIDRIESLIEDRKGINADIKQVYEEAEHNGYNKVVIKDCVRIRNMDPDERAERLALTDMYLKALGLL